MTKKKVGKAEYSRTFQQNAVSLVKTTGKSAAAVSQQLGVPVWKLRNWVRESSDNAERSAEIDEVLRLRDENKRLKEDLEFLKKAAAYFAKNQP